MRKSFIHILSLFVIIFVAFSCTKNKNHQPGINLSFDDRTVNEWFELRPIFKKYNAKATFFITQWDSLSPQEISRMKILEQEGHEIGFHGNMHVFSEYYIKNHSYSEYLKNEITSGLELMGSKGFRCVSFAYPYGSKYWFTDFLLLRKFKILRSVSPLNKEKNITTINDIYYSFDGDQTVSALSIDANSGITEGMIERAIGRAISKKEVLMLYGHTPSKGENLDAYTFKTDFLESILLKAKQNQLKFYTMQDLAENK